MQLKEKNEMYRRNCSTYKRYAEIV